MRSGTQVVCSEATLAAVEAARQAGRSRWRVSSTVFSHIASDQANAACLRPCIVLESRGCWKQTARQQAIVICRHAFTVLFHEHKCCVSQVLKPLGGFATPEAQAQYPSISAGAFVENELESIRLKA